MLREFLLRTNNPFLSPHFPWAGEIRFLLVVARTIEILAAIPSSLSYRSWYHLITCIINNVLGLGFQGITLNTHKETRAIVLLIVHSCKSGAFAELSGGHSPQLTLPFRCCDLLLGGRFRSEQVENSRRIKVPGQELWRGSLQGFALLFCVNIKLTKSYLINQSYSHRVQRGNNESPTQAWPETLNSLQSHQALHTTWSHK